MRFFILVGLLLTPMLAFAQETPFSGIVCRLQGAGVYDSPEGNQLVRVANQTPVQVRQIDDSQRNTWAEIELSDGTRGWMMEAFIEKTPLIYPVNADSLNVRAEPNTQAEILGTLSRGSLVEFLGHETLIDYGGFWIYVRQLETGLEGWVSSQYLSNGKAARECTPVLLDASPATPIEAVAWVTSSRVRRGPSNDTRVGIITEIPKGTRVTVLEELINSDAEHPTEYQNEAGHYYLYFRSNWWEGAWLYVHIHGTDIYGWVHYSYSLVPIGTKVRATVNSLNIHGDPSSQAAIGGTLENGVCVAIQDATHHEGEGWFYIGSGWVSGDYLELCE